MSTGVLRKLNIAPGINRNITEYQAEGAWVSGDKVRFSSGYAEKLGGWEEKDTDGSFYWGVARAIHPWATLDGSKLVALGTHNSLWIEEGGKWTDITPVRASVVHASAFSGVAGSNVVNASITGHGAQKNDLVYIGTSTELVDGAQTVSAKLYRVVSAGTDHFDVSVDDAATSSFTAEGAVSTSFQFLITAGLKSNGALFGWGSDAYSDGFYGLAGSGGVATGLRQWSLENWGEDLIAAQKNGMLYYWEVSAGGRAIAVSGAPTQNHFMFLSNPSRQVVLCGTCVAGGDYDPMLIRWSDTEDYTEWTAAATNGSGDYRIPIGSKIVGAMDAKKQHVIFSDEGAYAMNYVGPPDYYGFERLGGNCGLAGMNAGCEVNGLLYWMSPGGFYTYDGTVRRLRSTLDEAIFNAQGSYKLNLAQKEKVFCGVNGDFGEIWWFYPAGTNTENSRYVIYNYIEDTWYDGNMERTTWTGSDIFPEPLATMAVSVSHSLYEHEVGYDDDSATMGAFLLSGEVQINEEGGVFGDKMLFIDQFVPDMYMTAPVKIYLDAKKYPNAAEEFTKGPFTLTPTTGKKSVRLRGRQMNLMVACTVAGAFFRMGDNRVRIQPDGER